MNPAKQPYNKPPLSFEKQAALLIQRGLIADQDELTNFLRRTNYYRFSTYLYPFRLPHSDDFQPNTAFSDVCVLYDFDQALRALLFNALAALEISMLRTHFVEFFTQRYGAFGYTAPDNFDMPPTQHETLMGRIQESVDRSQEEFVKHFRDKYSDDYLPLWIAVETMSFGNTMTMVLNMHREDKKGFAQRYGVAYVVMDSWLRTLNYVRNCCAHHARLWNRALAIKPLIPHEKHRPEFHKPPVRNSRIFAVLTIAQYLLSVINPSQGWKAEVLALLDTFPSVPLDQMGFPENWQEMPMWRD
jgi:abortive infection bacteriophage resistance protein